MYNKIFGIIKNIVIVLILSFFSIVAALDFIKFNDIGDRENTYSPQNQYNEDKEVNIKIFGNHYLSNEIIAEILNNKEYLSSYDSLLNDLKIVTISNKEKIILITENHPIFYDKNYIYLSSKKRISSDIAIPYKENLIFLDFDLKEAPNQFIEKIKVFTNHIKNNYNPFYSDLDSIVYSSAEMSLNIFINGCKIKLTENIFEDKLDINNLKDKIYTLDAFIKQENKDINQIKEIDLRWDKESIVIWEEFKKKTEDI